jgi:hypothetical protein
MHLRHGLPLLVLCLAACGDGAPPAAVDGDPPHALRSKVDELRAYRDAPRHSADGGGRAWLVEDEPVVAGTFGRWTIVYEAGPEGVAVGGAVRLTVSPFWGWTPAQARSAERAGMVEVTTEAEGVELETTVPGWVDVRIGGRALAEGERITFVYGAGPALAQVDRYAERDSRFWVAVDGDGDGVDVVVADSPGLEVLAGPPAHVIAHVPSVVRPGAEASVRVALLDQRGNACERFTGTVELASDPPGLALPKQLARGADAPGSFDVRLVAPQGGVYRVHVRATPEGGGAPFEAHSNRVHVDDDAPRVLWADLHGHSGLSDGTGTPEDFYRYARDVAALDVAVLTDHDHWGKPFLDETPEMWRAIRDTTAAFHEPGRFVTLLGYEWTSWIHGHRHVLYFQDDGPVLSSLDEATDDPDELWAALREHEALTFAHHSAGGPIATNWDFAPDPELEPVTEITSVHGSSEALDSPGVIYDPVPGNFVRDVLERGYRLGFVGSGDSHDGHPGLAHFGTGQGGVAAILAEDLTRDGVLQALKARRCYATNGPRIILRVALAGHPMGAALPAPGAESSSTLFIGAIGTGPIEFLEVIRSGRMTQRLSVMGTEDVAVTVDVAGLVSGETLYVRVVQQDGGAAWSSPFFLD